MLGDRRTLETLDFAAIRDRIVALTATERGRMAAEAMLPLDDFEHVNEAQRATQDVRELVASSELRIGRAVDTAKLTAAAAVGAVLSAADLRAIADALATAAAAYDKARSAESETIARLTAPYRPLRELVVAITGAVDERGAVLDSASAALRRIRRSVAASQNEARERVSALVRSAKYAKAIQDAVVTIREGRFVVPIKAEFSGAVAGIVHDTSSSGQTVFVEPLEALEINNRVRTLRIEEEREVARILQELSQNVSAHAPQIEANVEMLAQLDVLAAKAGLAIQMHAVAPELSAEAVLRIQEGRHPLLGTRAVPQSISIGDAARLIVISGPNMGGKTVALKMVGLFVAMAYCGLQLPASSGTRVGYFRRIFADIGDEQSIAENTSTFSAHLARLREIIAEADAQSLVLIDEIGGGTEPAAGAALAVAILEHLVTLGACGVVTTHSTELKLFAHSAPGVMNASVRFDPNTFAPTYQLDIGAPGQSLAFPLARAMQIPRALIERAESLLESRERDYERALADLAAAQAAFFDEREQLEKERRHLLTLQDALRRRTEALQTQRREFAQVADERLRKALTDFTAELQRRADARASGPKVTASQSALLGRVLEELHRELGVSEEPGSEPSGERFEPGQRVHVVSLDQEAEVVADGGEHLLVALGAMRTTVSKRDVRPVRTAGKERPIKGAGASAALAASSAMATELDVRGKRYVEAEPIVERWIDEALLTGHSPLRLIHGKGTGLLGRGLQEYLREHAAVTGVRYGNEHEGGSGVTIFELR
jgi:DNA mismatch repair protein MutS2